MSDKAMIRNRIIWAFLWILSVVGISFFGGPVSYGFFTLLTLVPIVSLIYLFFVSACFRIYQELDGRNLVANRPMPFYFILKNEFFFGFCSVRVHFFSSFSSITDLDDGVEYELLPKTGIQKHTGLVCKYRGEYEVGIKSIEVRDYFGLFKRKFNNKETLRVIVKPDIVPLTSLKSIRSDKLMTRETTFNPTRPDVLVREYVAGDDVRFIHWKSSARSGELLVRKTTGEQRDGIGIVLSNRRHSEDIMEYLPVENQMLKAAIALSYFFTSNNTPVVAYLGYGQDSSKTAERVERFHEMSDWLSKTAFRDNIPVENCMDEVGKDPALYTCKTVFFILNEWTAAALSAVKKLQENRISTVIYFVKSKANKDVPVIDLPDVEFVLLDPEDRLEEVM